ncbi:unnamed protein product [Linum tenue]|uniref:DDB1- and CUL4-associated factor 13 n=1 Tax=Linum tenue TaxID=586396 RepID=A0AAV0I940_9ROSI|nr:unnamed protein product [Linum tenue]
MKVKVISRSTDEFTRERSQDLQRVFRNFDPKLRPQEKAVEYVRALNAAKLEKIFARPFIGAMDGHIDAISCMAKNPNFLKGIFSGSMDGDIRLWDIASRARGSLSGTKGMTLITLCEIHLMMDAYFTFLYPKLHRTCGLSRKTVCQFPGHQGAVRGLTASTDGSTLISCGTDCTVRIWSVPVAATLESDHASNKPIEANAVYVGKNAYWAVDHQWGGDLFATTGARVEIWNHNRSQPVNTFEWGTDTVISVRFNPGEPNLLATSASDRSIALYDLRMSTPARKLIMQTRTNSIAWNPMEPLNFTTANEDCSCYSYDARKLDEAKCVHKDHVSAVQEIYNLVYPYFSMDIDYSPTGREFVTGSYDRTVRIFPYNGGHSREIYHTKRMQRVFCVKFSSDASYIISGSDDTNLRLWKAKASEQMGVLLPREQKKHEYQEAVKNRYKHLPEVKRIVRHRHLPRPIYKAKELRRMVIDAEKKKEERRKAHSTPGSIVTESVRKRRIIREVE